MAVTLNASTSTGLVQTADTSGDIALQNNGTTAVTVTGGNVGVGTTSPANIFELKSATPIQIFNQTTGNSNQGIQFQANGTTYGRMFFNAVTGQCDFRAGLNNGDGYYLTYSTDGSERMRITSDGSIGFGCTSYGGINGISMSNASDSAAYGKAMLFNTQYNSTRNAVVFQYNSGTVGTIVTGTSTTAYNTSSDYRLKENIAPMTGALAKVSQLKPCTYTWKLDGSEGEGFIAHELAEVCPHAVSGEKDAVNENGTIKPQGIDTSFLVATLTAAIQELKAELDATKAEVAALKGVA